MDLAVASPVPSAPDFDSLWMDAVKEAERCNENNKGNCRSKEPPPLRRRGTRSPTRNSKIAVTNTSKPRRHTANNLRRLPDGRHLSPNAGSNDPPERRMRRGGSLSRSMIELTSFASIDPPPLTLPDPNGRGSKSNSTSLVRLGPVKRKSQVDKTPETAAAPQENCLQLVPAKPPKNKTRSQKIDFQRKSAESILRCAGSSGKDRKRVSYSLPTILHVSAVKVSANCMTGLVLTLNRGNEAGSVMVREITPKSIFVNTPLRPGDEILAINDFRVKCPQRAATIMKRISGEVRLLVSSGKRPPFARYVRVRRHKDRDHIDSTATDDSTSSSHEKHTSRRSSALECVSSENIGIKFETVGEFVRITCVDPNGLFAHASISPGDIVLAINGSVARDEGHATELLCNPADDDCEENNGLVCMLVYSMEDLRVGLVDRLLASPWKPHWSENGEQLTVSRLAEPNNRTNYSFVLHFQRDWWCQCFNPLQPLDIRAPLRKKNEWAEVFNSEVQTMISKINQSTFFVLKNLKAAKNAVEPPNYEPAIKERRKSRTHDPKLADPHRLSVCTSTTQPTDETDDETASQVSELSDGMIPVRSVLIEEGVTPMEVVERELSLLREKYQPRNVKLIDTYDDNVYVHMIVQLVDPDE